MESVVCDLCKATDTLFVAKSARFGIETVNVACKRCGFVYQNPRMTEEELSVFYHDHYRRLYSGDNEKPPQELVEEQIRRGKAMLEFCRPWLEPEALVLDIGCGPGGTLLPFRENGYLVCGVEPGPYGGWGAQNLGLQIYTGTLEMVDLTGIFPHLAILSFVLEHVPSPREVLRQIHHLVDTEGYLYIEVPNLKEIRGPVETYFHVAHLSYFTPRSISAMLQTCGFSVVRLQAGGRQYAIRVLAKREPQPLVPDQIDWSTSGDSAAEIQALVVHYRRVQGVEQAVRRSIRPLARLVYRVLAAVAGRDATNRVVQHSKMVWRRVRYGK